MSKRAAHRPPRLDEKPAPRAARTPPRPPVRTRLVRAHVTGHHQQLGRNELMALLRRVVAGDPRALLGQDRLDGLRVDDLLRVVRKEWGWEDDDATVTIDPDRTIGGFVAGRARVLEVARHGGRVAFATSRPASLLPLHQALAALARVEGAEVVEEVDAGPVAAAGRRSMRLWWSAGVAVITDGDSLVADPADHAFEEFLFAVGHPDLVVADRGFAGGALTAGIEVVAFADLDAAGLALARYRGLPLTLVPLQERRPPSAYLPLLDVE